MAITNDSSLTLGLVVIRYQALQQPPPPTKIDTANYLLECLERLICHSVSSTMTSFATNSSSSSTTPSSSLYQFALSQEDVTILAAKIFETLSSYLTDDYIAVTSFVPFLQRLLEEDRTTHELSGRAGAMLYNGERAVSKLLELMTICMEVHYKCLHFMIAFLTFMNIQPFEFVPCIDAIVHHLAMKTRCELAGGFQHLPEELSQVNSPKGTPSMPSLSFALVV